MEAVQLPQQHLCGHRQEEGYTQGNKHEKGGERKWMKRKLQ